MGAEGGDGVVEVVVVSYFNDVGGLGRLVLVVGLREGEEYPEVGVSGEVDARAAGEGAALVRPWAG